MDGTLWHSMARDVVLEKLRSTKASGLSTKEALARLAHDGDNTIPEAQQRTFPVRLKEQFTTPLTFVLLVAGGATLLLHEYIDAMVIVLAITINVAISLYQEGQAQNIFAELKTAQETYATVVRDGIKQRVLSHTLVVGDIVIINGGAAIPADIRLLEVTDLMVNEAALTGESLSVAKTAETVGRALPLADQRNMAWMGTLAVSGEAQGVVVATGASAQFGKIAAYTTQHENTQTPLQHGVRTLARFLMWVVIAAVALILVLGLIRGESLITVVLLAISIAVAAVPEGLPAAVTVVLAVGMQSLLKKGGLVKSLLAAETLGSTTVVLTDKTGTLTQGRMTLSGLYTIEGMEIRDTSAIRDNKELLKMAVLSSDAFVEHDAKETGALIVHGRPIEKAIVEAGLDVGLVQSDLFVDSCTRLDFVPFESARRYAVSLNVCGTRTRAYLSGSPEHLLKKAQYFFQDGEVHPMTNTERDAFIKTQEELSAEGLRFTALAFVDTKDDVVPEDIKRADGNPQKVVFAGLLAFKDAVRSDVREAIATTHTAGARVIMVTGDNPYTARAIAFEVGIDARTDAPVVTGDMLIDMTDEELKERLATHRIFARVVPEQKLRIVRLVRNAGEVVAMTGDGVNDAPALVAADIGIAVGSGTDVAKAAADIILIDNSFSVITAAIKEGRRIMDNVRKIITYLLSTSFSEIALIGGALAISAPLPILPTQILWANIVGEGFMSFPFAFEDADSEVMKRKPRLLGGAHNILTQHARKFVFLVGGITGVMLFGLFYLLLTLDVPEDQIHTMMFLALSLSSVLYSLSFKDFSKPLWKISLLSNKYLIAALIGSLVLLFAAFLVPALATLLSLVPLTRIEVVLLVVFSVVNVTFVEVAKHYLFGVRSRG